MNAFRCLPGWFAAQETQTRLNNWAFDPTARAAQPNFVAEMKNFFGFLQDMLGINVTYTVPGAGGQVECLYSVAGCSAPGNSSDRGCGPEGPFIMKTVTW